MKFRPQMQLRFRDEKQYEAVKKVAAKEKLSANEWIVQQIETKLKGRK